MPKIKHVFQVDQPISRVWAFFGDVPQVVDCMPGIEILEDVGGEAFKGRMRVKVGSMTANFVGEARVTETNDFEHSKSMSAPSKEDAALVQAKDVPGARLFLRSLWDSLKRLFR